MDEAARRVEHAYEAALADGIRTGDLAEPGMKKASTIEFTDAVLERLPASERESTVAGGVR
jgi:3-isopropylmalate dehydrogenase